MDEEATERGSILETAEVIKPIGGVRRNSTGKTSPTGLLSLSNSDQKPLPRYLQTSIKSCHDFCKYGRKHDFEGKEKHSFLHRSRNNLITVEQQNEAKALDFGERRKKPVSKVKSSSMQRIGFSDELKTIKQKGLSTTKGTGLLDKTVDKELQTLSPCRKNVVSSKQAILPSSPENEHTKLKRLSTVGRKERQIIKQKAPLQLKTFLNKPKDFKQKGLYHANKVDACGKPGPVKERTALPSNKGIASVKPKLLRQISVKKTMTAAIPMIMKQKASVPPKSIGIPAKPEVFLKAKKAPEVKSASALTRPAHLACRRNREDKISLSLRMTKVGERKVLKPSTASLPTKSSADGASNLKPRKYGNTKLMAPVKRQGNVEKAAYDIGEQFEKSEHGIDRYEEQILYVVEPKEENVDLDSTQQISDGHQILESMFHDEEEAEEPESVSGISDSSESLFDDVGTKSKSSNVFSKGEDRRRPRRTATVHPEDGNQPYKLKFRRGRVLEPQAESNGPRRLIFRRGRVVGENPNGNCVAGRRRFRRRNGMDVLKDPNADALGVVLRHQDTEGKKETQSLFNNVIEETASRLVETRKSKVKALVGAFETVISLQDSKPASTE
ncbi:uncharacterized protein [Elaeis guineensis]|uniref:Uncharacterized protein LOC105032249 n=1 Tax=Elaeis guineensis var. tenera TaxID=51953 RepID=A0A6I9Q913_ELAGV|nr:uncharacterized protein LOC105032249 [Elaeis guineensis]XP_019701784.1 uncharacterized protein LOC105032249 [Elaeis guineensis]XP_029116797.1 uncharacterized protein LOC105032249 [Elaeis guineensis]